MLYEWRANDKLSSVCTRCSGEVNKQHVMARCIYSRAAKRKANFKQSLS